MVSSVSEAKQYVVEAIAAHMTEDEVKQKIQYYGKLAEAFPEKLEDYQKKVSDLNEHLSSERFRDGKYPRGLDSLYLELIEMGSLYYALNVCEIKPALVQQSLLMRVWFSAVEQSLVTTLGKLVSRHSKDHSLFKVWSTVFEYLREDDRFDPKEIDLINGFFDPENYAFANTEPIMRFRNKSAAHNELTLWFEWNDFEKMFFKLVRIWWLLEQFSDTFIPCPFVDSIAALWGTDALLGVDGKKLVIQRRNDFIDLFKERAQVRMVTDEWQNEPKGQF